MADLHFVDFALIPSPVRKEKQFRLPDDFSEFTRSILPRTSRAAFGFPSLLRVFTDCTALYGDPQNVFIHDEGEARNFNISTLRTTGASDSPLQRGCTTG